MVKDKHKNCHCEVRVGPFGPHYSGLFCVRHNKWIKWLSKDESAAITKLIAKKETIN